MAYPAIHRIRTSTERRKQRLLRRDPVESISTIATTFVGIGLLVLLFVDENQPWRILAGALVALATTGLREFANSFRRERELRQQVSLSISLRGADLSGLRMRHAYLRSKDLTGAKFSNTDLEGADFAGAKLDDTRFVGASLVDAKFDDAMLNDASFHQADLHDASFDNARLHDTKFREASLQKAQFRGATLSACRFDSADIRGADFKGADIRGRPLFDKVCFDEETTWPDGTHIPPTWVGRSTHPKQHRPAVVQPRQVRPLVGVAFCLPVLVMAGLFLAQGELSTTPATQVQAAGQTPERVVVLSMTSTADIAVGTFFVSDTVETSAVNAAPVPLERAANIGDVVVVTVSAPDADSIATCQIENATDAAQIVEDRSAPGDEAVCTLTVR